MLWNILADPLAVRMRWIRKATAGLLFNFRTDPRTTPIQTPKGDFADLKQPATQYPTRFMRILMRPAQNLELSINVEHWNYVSIGQVLCALHDKLNEPITNRDWEKLTRSEKERVAKEFYERIDRSPYRDYQRDVGVRWMDLLCGNTQFCGLQPSYTRHDAWEVILGAK